MDIGISLAATQIAIGDEAAPQGSTDVFVVIGQSNAVGYAPDDGGAGYPDGTHHWTSAGAWAPIGFRLDHGPWETIAAADQFGFAKEFAIQWTAANPLSDLMLIGAADGGTGFANGDWTPGDAHYLAAVARINAAMSEAPSGAVLRGFLWHQGESDRNSTTYEADLHQMIDALRSDVTGATSVTPFIAGGHATNGAWWDENIQRSTQALPSKLAYCGYADISAPVEPTMVDGVHFDAATTRNLGQAYFDGLMRARTNNLLTSGSISTGTAAYGDLTLAGDWHALNLPLGAPASDRMVLIALGCRHDSTLPRPTSVSLGGQAAMRVVQRSTGRVSGTNVALYCARVPEGTTGDLAVTYDLPPQQAGAVVLPVYGAKFPLASAAGFGHAVGLAGHGTQINTTVTAQPGELVFAAAGAIAPGGANGQINLGNSTDNFIGGTNRSLHSGHALAAVSGDQQVICDFVATVVNYPTIAAMVLRPA